MPAIPEFQEVLDRANRQRGLNWLATPPPLCGVSIAHYTPRMRLDLEFSGNAFVSGLGEIPTRHDIFAFLWRLHPAWRPMVNPLWLKNAAQDRILIPRFVRACFAFRHPRAARAFVRLERHAAGLPLLVAIRDILAYLHTALTDRPSGTVGEKKPTLVPPPVPHWCDDLVGFFGRHFGDSRDTVLDAPLAQLYQVWRAYDLAHGGKHVVDEGVDAVAADFAARTLDEYRRRMASPDTSP